MIIELIVKRHFWICKVIISFIQTFLKYCLVSYLTQKNSLKVRLNVP